MHLVKEMYPDVPVVFSDTGLEYPEVRAFARERADVIVRPKIRFDQILTMYGYPIISKDVASAIEYGRVALKNGKECSRLKQLMGTADKLKNGKTSMFDKSKWKFLLNTDFKISDKCCYHMKKSPIKKYGKESGRKPYIGIMAEESRQRRSQYIKYGCNSFTEKTPSSKPLSIWLEQDILQYLKEFDVPYASVYGEITQDEQGRYYLTGCDRTGCVFCGFGAHLEKEPNRFQRLKETHPKLYKYCIQGGEYDENGVWQPNREGLGMGHVLDEINVKYD